jgi:ATP-dependent Clp protease protease subunit
MRERLNEILALHTGQPIEQIEKDVERDRIMSAAQAMEYGIVDQVIKHRE